MNTLNNTVFPRSTKDVFDRITEGMEISEKIEAGKWDDQLVYDIVVDHSAHMSKIPAEYFTQGFVESLVNSAKPFENPSHTGHDKNWMDAIPESMWTTEMVDTITKKNYWYHWPKSFWTPELAERATESGFNAYVPDEFKTETMNKRHLGRIRNGNTALGRLARRGYTAEDAQRAAESGNFQDIPSEFWTEEINELLVCYPVDHMLAERPESQADLIAPFTELVNQGCFDNIPDEIWDLNTALGATLGGGAHLMPERWLSDDTIGQTIDAMASNGWAYCD